MDDNLVDKTKHDTHVWIAAAKQRGFGGAFGLMLDVLAPLAPLASQLLLVVQPIAGIFGARQSVGSFAQLLDTPEGIEAMRQQLNQNTTID